MLTDTELIRKLEFFETLDDKIIKNIAGICIVREFAAGEAIVRQGEAGLGLYFITGGRAKVEVDREGHKIVVAELKEGDFLGEFAIIDDKTRSASVICLDDTRCLLLTRDSFAKLLRKHPEIANQMLRTLVGRIRTSNVRMTQPVGKAPTPSATAGTTNAPPAVDTEETSVPIGAMNGSGIAAMAEQIGAILPKPEELVQYYSTSKGRTQQFFNRFVGTIYAMKAMMRFSMAIVGCPVTVTAEQADPELLQAEFNGVHLILFPSDVHQTLRIDAVGDGEVSATVFRSVGDIQPEPEVLRLAESIREGDVLRWHFPAEGRATLVHIESQR